MTDKRNNSTRPPMEQPRRPARSRPAAPRPAAAQTPAQEASSAQDAAGARLGAKVVVADADGRHTARNVAVAVIAAVAAIAIIVAVLVATGAKDVFDGSAQEGQAPYKTAEEMQAELDRIVEEGMFNISIASVIEFDDGASEGTAYIENVPGNRYNMQCAITEDDTGEELYKSGVLKPNQFIEKIKLNEDLEQGSYPATATFTALDAETNEKVGQAAAKVTINVLG